MAGKKGRDASVLVNEFDLSRYLKKIAPSVAVDILDGTTFQPPGGFKEKLPGEADGKLSCEGFFQASDGTTPDAIDDVFHDIRGSETKAVFTGAPEGASAVGKRAFLMSVDESSHSAETVVDQLIMTQAEFESSSGMEAGVVLHQVTAETATGNGSSVDNGAATARGAVAHLHVTAASASDTLDVVVQHSADNSVWVDLITFAQKSAVGSERVEVTGTVNRYVRARRVIAGTGPSFTFAVAFARR